MMARYRSRMAMRPIQRIKHVVDVSATLTTPGTQLNTVVINAKDAPVLANVTEVVTGSKIHGIYLKVEVSCLTTEALAISNVYLSIMKNPGGNLVIPTANAVGANDNKRFVIHQEMVMINNATAGNPRILFNGVVAIPKGYSRFGPNDQLYVSVVAPAVDIAVCMQVHYKEFR